MNEELGGLLRTQHDDDRLRVLVGDSLDRCQLRAVAAKTFHNDHVRMLLLGQRVHPADAALMATDQARGVAFFEHLAHVL